jgi:hypothetical protein
MSKLSLCFDLVTKKSDLQEHSPQCCAITQDVVHILGQLCIKPPINCNSITGKLGIATIRNMLAGPKVNPLVTIIFLSDLSESVQYGEIWNLTILIYFSHALLTIYKQKSIFYFHKFFSNHSLELYFDL